MFRVKSYLFKKATGFTQRTNIAYASDQSTFALDPSVPDDPDYPALHDTEPHLDHIDPMHEAELPEDFVNPGNFDRLGHEIDFLSFAVPEGINLDYSRQVLENFSCNHAIKLTSNPELVSSYSFAAQVLAMGASEQPDFIVAKMDSSYDFFTRGRVFVSPRVNVGWQLRSSVGNDKVDGHIETEYYGNNSTSVARFNPSGTYTLNYTQAITKKWVAGVEVLHSEEGGGSLLRYATTYAGNFATILFSLATNGILTSGFIRQFGALKLGTDISFLPTQSGTIESVVTGGWEYSFGNSVARGLVTSDGRVIAALEEMLMPNFKCTLGAELNHSTSLYKLGLSMELYC